jgi:trehalose 6-phosphate phosphatase
MTGTLPHVISDIRDRVTAAPLVSLFLDFDGTLVPIESDPAKPSLSGETAGTLRMLARQKRAIVTVISGRAVEDLYTRVRLEGLIYAGNHGLEIFGRGIQFVEPAASASRERLTRLCEEIRDAIGDVPGAFLEFKGLTASVHYRMAAVDDYQRLHVAVFAAVERSSPLFRVNLGRKVMEILPRTSWHKGSAVRWINSHVGDGQTLSIYLGDDSTDEDAFAALPDAVTIRVGGAEFTTARYHLPDPASVHEFLMWLAIQGAARERQVNS